MQVMTIGEIDTKASSYELSFQLNLISDEIDFTKCPPPSEWIFTNGVVESMWGQHTEPNFHKVHVSGVFYNEIDFKDYPFEDITLSIEMGPPYPFTSDNTRFIINQDYSGVKIAGQYLSGYKIGDIQLEVSDFETPWATFPHFSMVIPLTNDPGMIFLKKIFPVLILAGFGYATFFMSPKILQDRLTILGTAMVGAIFFHAVFLLGELPSLGYLTIADKVMITVYSVFAFALIAVLRQQKYLNELNHSDEDYNVITAKSVNRKIMILTPIFAMMIFLGLYLI